MRQVEGVFAPTAAIGGRRVPGLRETGQHMVVVETNEAVQLIAVFQEIRRVFEHELSGSAELKILNLLLKTDVFRAQSVVLHQQIGKRALELSYLLLKIDMLRLDSEVVYERCFRNYTVNNICHAR
jgi:hypothetical protein